MINTDKELFRILNDKLNGLESPVSPDVWNGVQQHIGTAGKAAAAKTGFWTSKLFVGLAAAAVITGVVIVSTLNVEKETIAPIVQETNIPESLPKPESNSVSTDTSEMVLDNSSAITNKSRVEIVKASCDFEPSLEEEIVEKTTNYGTKDNSISENAIGSNNSERQYSKEDVSNSAEPLSAGFHARCVDAEDLRYFFFPKTDKAQSFKWIVSDGTESTDMSLAHVFEKEGVYTITLTVIGYDGQATTESESISVIKPVVFKIPTAISPGNSGKNDIIDFNEAIENEESIDYLVIRDKQGNVVYESKSEFVWNGHNKRQEICAAGVYTYVVIAIDRANKSLTNKGTIQLFHE